MLHVRRLFGACGLGLKASLALATVIAGSGVAHAQGNDYPTQRVSILVGFAAGGPVDVIARLIADRLQARWGEPVVVENRPGAGGNLAAAVVARAPPDGYTLLFTATGVVINQSLYDHPGYNLRDLVPISFTAINSLLLLPEIGRSVDLFVVVGKPGDEETWRWLNAKGINALRHSANVGFAVTTY